MVKVINNIYPCALGTTVSPNLDVFLKKSEGGVGHFRKKCNVISNKLEILEDALFESSNTQNGKTGTLKELRTEDGKSCNWAIFD